MNLYNNQIALSLTKDFKIDTVILNTYQGLYITPNDLFIELFDKSSQYAISNLIEKNYDKQLTESKRVKLKNDVDAFMFLLNYKDTITVLILSIHQEISNTFDEMIEINNSFTNSLRTLFQKISKSKDDVELLEEIMKINNELMNTKRKLIIQNNKLDKLNSQLQEINYTDFLTKISNRRKFLIDVYDFVKNEDYYLFMMDVNNFKVINDTYGHQKGDETLVIIASLLHQFASIMGGVAYRLGGDEFSVLIPKKETFNLNDLIVNINNKLFSIDNRIGIAYGAVLITKDTVNKDKKVEHSMHKADLMMYETKKKFYQSNNIIKNR